MSVWHSGGVRIVIADDPYVAGLNPTVGQVCRFFRWDRKNWGPVSPEVRYVKEHHCSMSLVNAKFASLPPIMATDGRYLKKNSVSNLIVILHDKLQSYNSLSKREYLICVCLNTCNRYSEILQLITVFIGTYTCLYISLYNHDSQILQLITVLIGTYTCLYMSLYSHYTVRYN
jgi:hypothetical protein